MLRVWLAAAVAAIVSACASQAPQSGAVAEMPANYRQIIAASVRETFMDPYSIRDAQIAEPQWLPSWVLTEPSAGWTVCVRANAKNRAGAYTGLRETVFLIRGQTSVAHQDGPAPYYCGSARYSPFIEIEQGGQAKR